jgi:hypothetical protein
MFQRDAIWVHRPPLYFSGDSAMSVAQTRLPFDRSRAPL